MRLGVNIDHVATLRNARGEGYPDLLRAVDDSIAAGADGITAHLREDRRHILDDDIYALKRHIKVPLNMEMAATIEMLKIALQVKPNAVCLVPEKRHELTTEGGLDLLNNGEYLQAFIMQLSAAKIRVSLFIDANEQIIKKAIDLKADIIELHTGSYANLTGEKQVQELDRIKSAAKLANQLGLEVHAGHGLNYDNVADIAAIPELKELNIGHFLISEAIFVSLKDAVKKMHEIINKARG